MYAPLVTAILIAAGRHHDADTFADSWTISASELGGQPLHRASAHHATALADLGSERTDKAVEHAHELLEIADRHGYVLMQIDALHILIAVNASRSNAVAASRLAGAAISASQRIGYVGPVFADPTAPADLARRLAATQPESFAAGAALELADAVELARRSRGDRSRPTFGWASLTPTETRVADLACEGLTNQAIGHKLLMSPATVKTHLTHIFSKLDVSNRTQLAAQRQSIRD